MSILIGIVMLSEAKNTDNWLIAMDASLRAYSHTN
jgi:hypothetical protein